MPSDITGTDIIDEDLTTGHRKWTFVEGPIFGNILLADEINRTPPKTQSALLEAMQEHSCTVRGHLYQLPAPFFVLATQNPIELEGTYPLPEAQLDRFLFNSILEDLSADDELKVIDRTTATRVTDVKAVTSTEDLLDFQQLVRMVPIAETLSRYVISLVRGHTPQERRRARFREEVCQLRRQCSRRAVHRAGGEGARPLAQALSRHVRRHHVHHCARAAPSRAAQLPRRVGSHRYRRNSHPSHRVCAAAQGELMLQRFLDPRGAGRYLLARPAGQNGRGWLCGRSSPLAGFRLQPGVRRVPRLHAGRRPAPCGLEPVRAHGTLLSQALSRRNQQPAHDSAGCQQLHAVHLRAAHEDGLRAVHRASLFYLAIRNQRDAAGLIVFDDEVREYIRPSTRQGSSRGSLPAWSVPNLMRAHYFKSPCGTFRIFSIAAALPLSSPTFTKTRNRSSTPSRRCAFTATRSFCFMFSTPRRFGRCNERLDVLVDLETDRKMEVVPDYVKTTYRAKVDAHLDTRCARAHAQQGWIISLLVTNQPLDAALREYLTLREAGKED
jgi:hypothetical protein